LEKRKKFNLFKTKAKLFFGLHSALSLFAKVSSIVLYFAPIMGLFGLDAFYEAGVLQFSHVSFMGKNWPKNDTSMEDDYS